MSCKDNKDGSCTVEYVPFTAGDYDVNITFGGRPIPGAWGENCRNVQGLWWAKQLPSALLTQFPTHFRQRERA